MTETWAAIEPRLVMRGLQIQLPPDVELDLSAIQGLAGTNSIVSHCDVTVHDEPVVRITAAGRIVVLDDRDPADELVEYVVPATNWQWTKDTVALYAARMLWRLSDRLYAYGGD